MNAHFNTHGGAPGRAPSMTKDFHVPDGVKIMGSLNDSDAKLMADVRRREEIDSNRRVAELGNNSLKVSTHNELRGLRFELIDFYLTFKSGFCVYVVGEHNPSIVKIGRARNPIKRLATLQTGNPEPLYLHRVFFLDNEADAKSIEYETHQYASNEHIRMEGEWFECSPHNAYSLIKHACDKARINYVSASPEASV